LDLLGGELFPEELSTPRLVQMYGIHPQIGNGFPFSGASIWDLPICSLEAASSSQKSSPPKPQHGDPKAASYLLDMGELKLKTPLYL